MWPLTWSVEKDSAYVLTLNKVKLGGKIICGGN